MSLAFGSGSSTPHSKASTRRCTRRSNVTLYLLRQERGCSLRDAAKRAGISFTRLGEWERGFDTRSHKPIRPSFDGLFRLARAYGIPSDELLHLAGYDLGMSADERRLLGGFRELPDAKRAKLLAELDALRVDAGDAG